ncbi:hypothetical protein A2T98_14185 [Nodularia spumigena CENA596]|uniref:Peptidase S74 domain-containing protein n=1 Tax=Nodularia spumigena CENA596 TaxID=1819295 RepID=A0A166J2W2_NODSP|nr:DUF6519 domain-containing protein [Nodularia spumigena]KZL49160.1 hypothetical protein A2T98_14185 [Nodularia spumigena CENA596]
MKGDITRLTFRPEKHYQAVRMQQGRLQLDADWNEQVDIQNYLTQSLAKYIIGDSGVLKNSDSFRIDVSESAADFKINAGKMYVNGIICELEQNTTYKTQLDYPNPNSPELIQDKFYLAYIDVWERDITALEDPEIREAALKGLDTATRTKTIWQVKLVRVPHEEVQNNEITNWQFFANDLNIDRQVYLNAATANSVSKGELVNPKKGYLGSENQLYRVEIHKPITINKTGEIDPATFKWSRNNGVTVSAIESVAGNTIYISNVGRDDLQSFKPNQWVEIIDEAQELKNEPGKLFRLQKVFNKQLDVVGDGDPIEAQFAGKKNLKMIGWQEDQKTKKAEIKVSPDWIELEQGIYIQFDAESTYKTGDYWLIPARAYTKDIDWPYDDKEQPIKQRSPGIKHHYSPLALLEYRNGNFTHLRDYRPTFPSLINALDKTGDTMTGDLEIQANLYVTNGGKVGIGTKEPKEKLHIDGNVRISNGTKSLNIAPQIDQWMQFTTNLDGYNFDKGIRIQNGLINGSQTTSFLDINTGEANLVQFKTNLNGYYFDKDIQIQSGVIRSDANLLLQTNGNVGIGVDIPDEKLQVDGVVRIGKTTSFLDISTGENNLSHFKTNLNGYSFDKDIQIQSGVIRSDANLLLQTNGNVGIGVDIPEQKLHVDGVVRIGTNTSILDISTGENNLSHFKTNLNGYSFDKDIQIQSGVIRSDANLLLQTNGNVGIGVDIPDEKLQVDGVVRIGKTTSFLDISTGENNLAQFKTNLNGYSFDKDIQIQSGVINGNLRVNGRILQDSSRELKENITELSSQEVTEILRTIKPIKFNYKNSIDKETQAGFLSEDVPSLLTLSDNTAISPVDLVAVLTKAVKDQNIQISLLLNALGEQRIQIATLVEKVSVLESRNL